MKFNEMKSEIAISYFSTTLLCKNILIRRMKILHFEIELI